MKLYKIGGRRPAEDDDGWTICHRYVLIDTEEDRVGKQLVKAFKNNGGQEPEMFVDYVNANTMYEAQLLNDPIVSHELEHRDSDFADESGGEGDTAE